MIAILGGGKGKRGHFGRPRRVGPRGVGPRRVGSSKFRAFFPSPTVIFFHSSLFSWNAGDAPHEDLLKPERPLSSPAFCRRRLHTNTDPVDCTTQTVLFPFLSSFSSFFSLSKNWPKSKLAEVEIGRNRNWPNALLNDAITQGQIWFAVVAVAPCAFQGGWRKQPSVARAHIAHEPDIGTREAAEEPDGAMTEWNPFRKSCVNFGRVWHCCRCLQMGEV